MGKSRFSDEQIIGMLQQEAGLPVAKSCRKHGMSDASFCESRAKYGGLDVSKAERLRGREAESAKLKRLLAEAMLDGRRFRSLAGVDDGPRECMALVADTSLPGAQVVRELDAIMARRGKPAMITQRWRHGTDIQRRSGLVGPKRRQVAAYRSGQAAAERLSRAPTAESGMRC